MLGPRKSAGGCLRGCLEIIKLPAPTVETPRGASPGRRNRLRFSVPPAGASRGQSLPLRLGDAPRGVSTVGGGRLDTFQTPSYGSGAPRSLKVRRPFAIAKNAGPPWPCTALV